MAHFGLICPPGTSHVTGLTTIGRELCRRGHRATVFNISDVEDLAAREGVGFQALGATRHPKGSFERFSAQLSHMQGLQALRFGLRVARDEIDMLLDEAPGAMQALGVTSLLVDQGQPAGSTIAERLGLPFITICNAVPVDPNPEVPLSTTSWGPPTSAAGRLRNRLVYQTFDLLATPIRRKINEFRQRWGLAPLRSLYQTFSTRLQLAQETADFDFPRRSPPPALRYIGLIRRASPPTLEFPFERLDGRPIVYATLGTVRHDDQGVFGLLAEACAGLGAQLVVTLGGTGEPGEHAGLPGRPVVVKYAPQMAVIERAAVTVCHGGNNTVLESLACGVPVLALPMNGDQYGVAARLDYAGAGAWLPIRRLTAARLLETLTRLRSERRYAERARTLAASIASAGGAPRAADLIEHALGLA